MNARALYKTRQRVPNGAGKDYGTHSAGVLSRRACVRVNLECKRVTDDQMSCRKRSRRRAAPQASYLAERALRFFIEARRLQRSSKRAQRRRRFRCRFIGLDYRRGSVHVRLTLQPQRERERGRSQQPGNDKYWLSSSAAFPTTQTNRARVGQSAQRAGRSKPRSRQNAVPKVRLAAFRWWSPVVSWERHSCFTVLRSYNSRFA